MFEICDERMSTSQPGLNYTPDHSLVCGHGLDLVTYSSLRDQAGSRMLTILSRLAHRGHGHLRLRVRQIEHYQSEKQ